MRLRAAHQRRCDGRTAGADRSTERTPAAVPSSTPPSDGFDLEIAPDRGASKRRLEAGSTRAQSSERGGLRGGRRGDVVAATSRCCPVVTKRRAAAAATPVPSASHK